jgi:rod shape-determining protein MreC
MRNARRSRLVLTILLLAAFSLITLDYRSDSLNGVRSAASTVFGPIEDGVSDVTHPIGSWFSSVGHLGSFKHENSDLKKRVAQLQSRLRLTAAQRSELAQDQKLLHIAGIAQFTVVAARVTAYGGGLVPEETATINRGRINGIKANETVIDGDGLVGRTVVVGRTTSTILLADDPTFTVGVRLESKQLELGSVTGGGRGHLMTLQLFNSTTRLSVGEQLVSEGSLNDTPFVPEVPVGRITHVNPLNGGLAETATVQPFVDYTAIDIVAVVVHAPKAIKHDSLLPAAPTPAPTVTVTVTATPGTSTTPLPGQSAPSTGGTTGATTNPGHSTSASP